MAKDKDDAPLIVRLAELVGKATADDLAAIDADIAAKRAEIDGLTQLRKLIAVRLGIEEPKKGPGGRPGPRKPRAEVGGGPTHANGVAATPDRNAAVHARRVSIARLLSGRGPLFPAVIANELDIEVGNLTYALKSDWFENGNGGWRLTAVGRKEALGAA